MKYTSRIGDTADLAHVNHSCPCGCEAGLIYERQSGSSELGQCCCGRLLWVGARAEEVVSFFYEEGVDYRLDVGSVTLPWGEETQAALAVPLAAIEKETKPGGPGEMTIGERVAAEMAHTVVDVICGMPIRPEQAAGTSSYKGETFHFCSPGCKARFDSAPGIYAAGGGR
jgi:YHS domain-containing protein